MRDQVRANGAPLTRREPVYEQIGALSLSFPLSFVNADRREIYDRFEMRRARVHCCTFAAQDRRVRPAESAPCATRGNAACPLKATTDRSILPCR